MNNNFPKIKTGDIIEVYNDTEMRFFCNDECEQFDGIVHPDEDWEFKEEDITRVWRQVGEDYFCIYKGFNIKNNETLQIYNDEQPNIGD